MLPKEFCTHSIYTDSFDYDDFHLERDNHIYRIVTNYSTTQGGCYHYYFKLFELKDGEYVDLEMNGWILKQIIFAYDWFYCNRPVIDVIEPNSNIISHIHINSPFSERQKIQGDDKDGEMRLYEAFRFFKHLVSLYQSISDYSFVEKVLHTREKRLSEIAQYFVDYQAMKGKLLPQTQQKMEEKITSLFKESLINEQSKKD